MIYAKAYPIARIHENKDEENIERIISDGVAIYDAKMASPAFFVTIGWITASTKRLSCS
uniref:Uncharacterized protein n=1 Tax=Peronospora matthiolae TaxID=2874970 RepID=A0AAV1UHG7_9STRA